jgi:hypothetical protein
MENLWRGKRRDRYDFGTGRPTERALQVAIVASALYWS